MSRPKISIIIVNWNGINLLEKCLSSLLKQTFKSFEIILVDNNSKDESVEFIKKKYPGVIIIENPENYGFARGNNIGIKKSNGDYILLLNNDTWVKPNFLEQIFDFYKNNIFDVIAPRNCFYNGKQVKSKSITIDFLGYPCSSNKECESFYLPGACLFCSKKLYKDTGGLDENFFMYFEETDWFWRLNLLKKKISFVEEVLVFHKIAASTGRGINYRKFLWRNQNNLQMLLKNYSLVTLVLIIPIYLTSYLIEFIILITLLKFNIAKTYPLGIYFNLKNLRRTLKERRKVQEKRLINDFEILNKMSKIPGKLKFLYFYFIKKLNK